MPRITIARIAAALSILLLASCQQSAIKDAIASQLSLHRIVGSDIFEKELLKTL